MRLCKAEERFREDLATQGMDGREQLKNYQSELGATSVELCRRGDGLGAGLPSLAQGSTHATQCP